MKQWARKKIDLAWEKLKPRPHHSIKEQRIRKAIIAVLGAGIASFAFLILYSFYLLLFVLPSPGSLRDLNLTQSTLIMDRKGGVLYAIHGEENRKSLSALDEISPWLQEATIAIEDDQFYDHIGIDVPALFRAVLSEVGIGKPRGGSTITQQFVKNTFLSSEHSYQRKLKEILLSLGLELKFSKDEILLMYLNAIPYGSNAYGVETAANRYFGKSAKDLNLSESAILASIPQAPTRYSPYGNYRYSLPKIELTKEVLGDRKIKGEADLKNDEWARGLVGKSYTLPDGSSFYLKGRSDLVLDRMLELDVIDQKEHDDALAGIQALAFTPYAETFPAPHFVLWVKQILEEKYGAAVVEQGGLKVYTTLDPEFQKAAEEAVASNKDRNLKSFGAQNASLVSVQPQTGQILAMVGSADYRNDEIDGQVNMNLALRQPGSSFKPFVYSLALLNQYTPATVLYDVLTDFGGNYIPKNYAGDFLGPLTIREALGKSRNIPAIKAYFLAGREDAIVPYAKSFGLAHLDENADYGPPLALGAAEVTPLELAEAYGVFANGGKRVTLTPFLKIANAEGQVLEQWEESKLHPVQVLDSQVAYLINSILSDGSVAIGPGTRIDTLNNAAKTGTSNKAGTTLPNNGWIAAYTPTNVSIVWTGNADGSPMFGNADGYNNAAPIWKAFASTILNRLEPANWNRPAGIKEVAISKASGKLPNDLTPSEMIKTEVFADFAVPTEVEDAYQKILVESVTNRLATPYSPARAVEEKSYRVHHSILADRWPNWEAAVKKWAMEKNEAQPPTEYADDIHNANTAANVPNIVISDPLTLTAVPEDAKTVDINVDILDEGNGLKEIQYSMNGNVQFYADAAPFKGVIRLPANVSAGQLIEVKAEAIDQYGYSGVSTIQLRVERSTQAAHQEQSTFNRYFNHLKTTIFANV